MKDLPQKAKKILGLDSLVQVDVEILSKNLVFAGAGLVIMDHVSVQKTPDCYLLRNDPYTHILEPCKNVSMLGNPPIETVTHYYVGHQAREERVHQSYCSRDITRDYVSIAFFTKQTSKK